jgi:hypothetical protein
LRPTCFLHQIAPEKVHPHNPAWLKLNFFGIIARHSAPFFQQGFLQCNVHGFRKPL